MSKFKMGDRVRIVGTRYRGPGLIPYGQFARIESENPQSSFSLKTYRWGVRADSGTLYLVEAEDIELANPPIHLTLDAAVAAYTLACEAFEAAQLAVEKAKGDLADAKIALRDALDGEA